MNFDPKSKEIRPGPLDALGLALDTHEMIDAVDPELHPVFLFTPDMTNTDEHYHIELTYDQAKELHEWLSAYLTATFYKRTKTFVTDALRDNTNIAVDRIESVTQKIMRSFRGKE